MEAGVGPGPDGSSRRRRPKSIGTNAVCPHMANPSTFPIPSLGQAIGPGDEVKVALGGERFWIRVDRVQGPDIYGTVDSQLVEHDALSLGGSVLVNRGQVLDVYGKEGEGLEPEKQQDVVNAVIFRGQEPIGVIQAPEDHLDALADAIRAKEYELQRGTVAEDGTIEYFQECEQENPRPCEVNISMSAVADLAREAGVEPMAIGRLESAGQFTEGQAREAMAEAIDRMPAGELKENAGYWFDAAFGDNG